MIRKVWTKEETELLQKLFSVTSNKKIAEILKRSPRAIGHKGSRLDLEKEKEYLRLACKVKRKPYVWTSEKDKIMIEKYSSSTWEYLHKELDMPSKGAIVARAYKLGLTRYSPALINILNSMPLKLPDFELGWLVGLLDGEGCVSIYGGGRDMFVTISNTNLELLEKVKKVMGMGFIYECSRRKGEKRCWAFKLHDYCEVFRFLSAVRNHVIVKRDNVDIVLKFIELWKRGQMEGVDLTSEKQMLYEQIREVNQKGERV